MHCVCSGPEQRWHAAWHDEHLKRGRGEGMGCEGSFGPRGNESGGMMHTCPPYWRIGQQGSWRRSVRACRATGRPCPRGSRHAWRTHSARMTCTVWPAARRSSCNSRRSHGIHAPRRHTSALGSAASSVLRHPHAPPPVPPPLPRRAPAPRPRLARWFAPRCHDGLRQPPRPTRRPECAAGTRWCRPSRKRCTDRRPDRRTSRRMSRDTGHTSRAVSRLSRCPAPGPRRGSLGSPCRRRRRRAPASHRRT